MKKNIYKLINVSAEHIPINNMHFNMCKMWYRKNQRYATNSILTKQRESGDTPDYITGRGSSFFRAAEKAFMTLYHVIAFNPIRWESRPRQTKQREIFRSIDLALYHAIWRHGFRPNAEELNKIFLTEYWSWPYCRIRC